MGFILHRNCLLKHVIEGRIEVMERRIRSSGGAGGGSGGRRRRRILTL